MLRLQKFKRSFQKEKRSEDTAPEIGNKTGSDELLQLSDTKRISNIGLGILGLGFGCFILWTALAPLDEGVPSQGTVVLETKRRAIQHLQGGIVASVNVKEGDQVKEGDLLIKLVDTTAKANFEAVRQQYYALKVTETRLISEQLSNSQIILDQELLAASAADPALRRHIAAQQALFLSKQRQVFLLEKELSAVRELAKDGYATLVRQMELERQVIEYRKEVEKELSAIRPEIQSITERFKAIREDLIRTEVRAPVNGQVVGLAIQTVGGVVSPGQKIMDIVPGKEELILEAQIQPHLIDRVRVGDLVDIRFYTFPNTPQLVIEGKLETLSTDVLTNPADQASYYLARVRVTAGGLSELGARRLQPGMPAEVVVKTGSRTLLQYLLHPLLKRMSASLKEE